MRADTLRLRSSVLAALLTVLVGWSLSPQPASAQLLGSLIVTELDPAPGG